MPDFEFTPGTDETLGRIDTPYCDPDDFSDEPRRSPREGLPPKFRMRHAPHYVEQLMGEIAKAVTGTRLMNSEPLAGPSRFTPSFQASTATTAAGPIT